MTEGHYAVRAEDFDRLVAERDEARAEAAYFREQRDGWMAIAHQARQDRDAVSARADRLREAIRQHYREKVGVPDDEDVALWDVAGIREDDR